MTLIPPVYRNEKSTKDKNPLLMKARNKHYEFYITNNYPFLNDTEDCIDTFTLGTCFGVSHANEGFAKEREAYEELIKELKNQLKAIVEDREEQIADAKGESFFNDND